MAASGPAAKVIIADRGYDSDKIRNSMEAQCTATVIPMRKNRKATVNVDGYIYAMRNRIERCFNKLKNFRRLATRYDKTAVDLAIIRDTEKQCATPKNVKAQTLFC
jgi:transposase